jgi:hypothetical protein
MDKNFIKMANNFSCDTEFDDQSYYEGGVGWRCFTKMPVLGNETVYYIKCKDRPWDENESARNVMENGRAIKMKRTTPLEIISAKPDGETLVFGIEPATVEMRVETKGGVDGTATCWYSFDMGNFSAFYETGSSVHKNQFDQITNGDYKLRIRCEDSVGNMAVKDVSFRAELDTAWPKIARVYREGGDLVIKTSEESSCAISREKCDFLFENATLMSGSGKEHRASIEGASAYYVQCRDRFGNHVGGCDMTIRTVKLE